MKLAWFTGVLAGVGVLQLVVMFLTWVIYRRQANEMRRQRHEMRRQRHVMYRQWKAMRAQIATMRDTAVRELRAYVCIESAQVGFMHERAPEMQVHIKNCGKTPAYDVQMWIGAALGAYPLTGALQPPPAGFQMSSSVLAPGARPHAMVYQHPVIPEELMPILGTPSLTLYVFGEIVYTDAFGIRRFTKYRLMHGGPGGARLRVEKGIPVSFLKPDVEGNEAN